MAGKGDRPRPVNKKKFDRNYERIFMKSPDEIARDSRLPEEFIKKLKLAISESPQLNYVITLISQALADERNRCEEEITAIHESIEPKFGMWLCPNCHKGAPSGKICRACLEQENESLKKKVEELETSVDRLSGTFGWINYENIKKERDFFRDKYSSLLSVAEKMREALERYVGKFGNCGSCCDEAKEALKLWEERG